MSKKSYDFNTMIKGKEQYYSDEQLEKKLKKNKKGLGYKALHAATTLYCALKSKEMSKGNKLIVLGALGYFIFPFDVISDFLPLVGLTDDIVVIMTALAKVYTSITPEMKAEADRIVSEKFGYEEAQQNQLD